MTSGGVPFGRYTLLKRLAEGGMAEVFLAQQRSDAGVVKLVALKRMLPHLSSQPQFVAMFLDEARLASMLSHPNIAQVFDFGNVDGQYFLTMELLVGLPLSRALMQARDRKSPIPVALGASIVAQVAEGLHYAHTLSDAKGPLKIIHRDISPSNIFLTWQGSVKIIDFGIAHAASRLQEKTETGVFKGKIAYSSPEQIEGEPLDARSDVFSIGVVLFELLTSTRAFRRKTDLETLNAVLREPRPKARDARPDLPPVVDAILGRALASDKAQRFSSGNELARALDPLIVGRPRIDVWLESLFDKATIAASYQELTDPRPALGEFGESSPVIRSEAAPTSRHRPPPPPVEALRPSQTRRAMILAAGAAGGLAIGITAMVLRSRSSSVETPAAQTSRQVPPADQVAPAMPSKAGAATRESPMPIVSSDASTQTDASLQAQQPLEADAPSDAGQPEAIAAARDGAVVTHEADGGAGVTAPLDAGAAPSKAPVMKKQKKPAAARENPLTL